MRSRRARSYVRAIRASRRRRIPARLLRMVAAVIAVAGVIAAMAITLPNANAAGSGTYRDNFNSASYSNSDGTITWSTPWLEIGESDGPDAGFVQFATTQCLSGSCLWFTDGSLVGPVGAQRTADLSGAGAATMTFSYQRAMATTSTATEFYVEASTTGSDPWTRLRTIEVSATDTSPRVAAVDLSAHISATTAIRFISNGQATDNQFYLDDLEIEAVPASAVGPEMWFTTRDNTTSGVPGLMSWQDGDLLSFSEPNLNYEPGTTSGTVSLLANWNPTFGGIDVSGLHLVTTDVTIGGSVALQIGDLLFNLDGSADLTGSTGTLSVKREDVIRFRPDTPGDYSAGSFAMVLENPMGAELRGLTLVEQDTLVGEVTLTRGSFLLARSGGSEHSDVWWYQPTSAGSGSTSGTITKLLEGDETGVASTQIWGIELLETGKGWPFPRGSIVLSLEGGGTIDGVVVTRRDLVTLVVGRTSVSGTARVTAIVAWEGDDLGLDEDKERIDGFTFADLPASPRFAEDLQDRTDPEQAVISFSATATDPNGDPITYSATGLPPGISIDPGSGLISGTIDYSGAASSPYAVTLRATDPGGLFDEDTFEWTVTDVNAPPDVTNPGGQADAEADAVSLQIEGSDFDGNGLTWTASGLPAGLAIDPVDGLISGTLTYDASSGSPYAVTVRATDDGTPAEFTEVTFSWTVSNTNQAPVVTNPGDQSNAEGDPVALAASGLDPDGDSLIWSATGLPAGLSIDAASGIISGTITFAAGAASPYTTTITATDDGGLFDQVTFTWSVTETNQPPQLTNPGSQSHSEGDVVSLQVQGSDPDGNAITWSASGLPLGLSIDPDTGLISGTLTYAAAGVHPVTVRATDDGVPAEYTEESFTWTVADVNQPPVVGNPGDRSNAEGDPVTFAMSGSDPDGDGLTWTATMLPDGLAIDPDSGIISGTITFFAEAGSPHAVTVRATDDGSPSQFTEVDFSWTVSDTNQAPVVTNPGDQSDAEGDSIALQIVGSDPDGDGLTWTAAGLPLGLSIDAVSGLISGTPTYDAAGIYPVAVRATDDGSPAAISEVSFIWTIDDTNRAPQVLPTSDRSDAEGDVVSLAITGSDPDNDGLTWSATGLPPGLTIGPSSGTISGTLGYNASPGSPYSVTVRATDDGTPALYDETTFTWEVANTNRAPSVSSISSQSSAEGQTVSLQIEAVDPDGDAITWTAVGLPPGLSIGSGSGQITGTLGFEAAGDYSVTVRATDDGSPTLYTERSFTWEVTNTNRAPQVLPTSDRSDAEGDVVSVAVIGSDPDGDGLTWSATGLPPGLTISPTSGTISGTLGYNASPGSSYSVTVRAADDGTPALYDETTFTWEVANTNRAPSVSSISNQSAAEGQTVSLQVEAVDPDGDGLTWSATGLPPGLSIGSGSGQITGTLGFTSAGDYSVTVRATDDGSPTLFTERSFTWEIANTNRAAVVQNPGQQFTEEGSTVSVAMVGSDPDGDNLTWSATGLPTGLAISPTSGVISGTLGFALAEKYSVTVSATDDGTPSLESQVSFTWTIGEVNRAPQIGVLLDRSSEAGASVTISPTAADPDSDGLTWSATGLPRGASISPTTGVITGAPTTPGTYGVTVMITDDGEPPATDSASFTWRVNAPPGFPVGSAVATQEATVGVPAVLAVEAFHPDGLDLTFSASGLPDGLSIDSATGVITGTPTTPQTRYTLVTVTDERGQAVSIGFVWNVSPVVNEPPVVVDDVVVLAADSVGPGGIVLDAMGNDYDPEGVALILVSAGPAEIGEVTMVDGLVVFSPPSQWLGIVTFPYSVTDGTTEVQGLITITIDEALSTRLGTGVLAWDPAGPTPLFSEVPRLTASNGTEVVLGTLFQSLHVLRVPLALLGGAIFWSLLFGGLFNLGFVVRGGLPRLVRRSSQTLAVVMVPHGGKVDVTRGPGEGDVVTRLLATERGLEATGRRVDIGQEQWIEIRTPSGKGWVPAFFGTEEVDRAGFAEDGEPLAIVRDFVSRLRARADFSDLTSRYGLFVAHHAPLVHFPPQVVPSVMEDPVTLVWKGRNPAYPDFEGTFDLAVATSVLDSYDHPGRELRVDTPVVPSTIIPVEFTNFHSVSIGADVHGPERLEQAAWLIMFTYEEGHPKIIGLVREG